jgi:hypothetical protein
LARRQNTGISTARPSAYSVTGLSPYFENRSQNCQSREAHVVSVDHFAHELRAQLKRADEQGATYVVINSAELCRSVRSGARSTDACCEAMHDEFKHGDVIVLGQGSGAGMVIRYQLPRPAQ